VNYYLVANGFENQLFIAENCKGFEEYRENLLKENFVDLMHKSGVNIMDKIVEFAKEINREMNAVIIFSEKELCANACLEIYNLALLTGKMGKRSNGIIALKEKNNSQGLFDMGIYPSLGVGGQPVADKLYQKKLRKKWHIEEMPVKVDTNIHMLLEEGKVRNLFIFGEDPLGCAKNKVKVAGWLSVADFVVVQDMFMTDTAMQADLVLPSSLPFESGGTFTNTQKVIQTIEPVFNPKTAKTSVQQLLDMLAGFELKGPATTGDVMMEAISLLPEKKENQKLAFVFTQDSNCNRFFDYGCDVINKRFEEEFAEAIQTGGSSGAHGL
jgi:formate dehydrogenase major subunit